MKIKVKNRSTWTAIVGLWFAVPLIGFPIIGNLLLGGFGIFIGLVAAVVFLANTVNG